MRILHIANGDDCLGSAKCLYELLEYENKTSWCTPVVITPHKNKMNEWCNNNQIENYSFNYYEFMYPVHDDKAWIKYPLRRIQYHINKMFIWKSINKIKKIKKIDIVHTNNSLTDFGKIISNKLDIPHIWHLRECGLEGLALTPYINNYIEYMIDGTTIFIAVSEAVKKEWVKLGISNELIKTIYDGVSIPKDLIIENKKNEGKIKFVLVGAYNDTKGQMQIINALKNLDTSILSKITIDFWGIGTENYTELLKNKIKQFNLEKYIHMKGYTDNVWNTLKNYDVGFNCTKYEAFGRTTVEYLISGIPVIAANLGSNIELINDVKFGKLYEYSDIDDLKKTIVYFVNNIEGYKENKKNLSLQCKDIYSSANNANKMLYLYKNIKGVIK